MYAYTRDDILDSWAKKTFLFYYGDSVKGYRMWWIDNPMIIISRSMILDESNMLNEKEHAIPS